ncbi:hypothetical protein BH18ACT15_BH18ACT15_05030 [soil metagenome]
MPNSKNLPAEFVETRFPVRIEKLALATDSGGPGLHRGGLGYDKEIRALRDASFLAVADRSILSCWGVKDGRAGAPFRVTIDPGGPDERVLGGLVNDEPVAAGQVIRIVTTGGGGWGDPLARAPEAVALDVKQGKVSRAAAESDYGVVLTGTREEPEVDATATEELRVRLGEERGDVPFFDHGPGYARPAGGKPNADLDFL